MATTILTIGFDVDTVGYKNSCLTMWGARGQDKIQPLRRQYYGRIHGLVHVVGSSDRVRNEAEKEELNKMMNEDEMRDAGHHSRTDPRENLAWASPHGAEESGTF